MSQGTEVPVTDISVPPAGTPSPPITLQKELVGASLQTGAAAWGRAPTQLPIPEYFLTLPARTGPAASTKNSTRKGSWARVLMKPQPFESPAKGG